MSFDSRAVRKKTRPMRPNPLTPTRVLIRGLLVGTTDRRSRQLGPNYTAAQRTRATVTAPIQPAPAARSARAHSASVAPVVSTSSTNRTWRSATAGAPPEAPRTIGQRPAAGRAPRRLGAPPPARPPPPA